MEARSWIASDESAKEMLARTLARRPFLLLPPLHRVPLRAGNVVEIVGPSASAKSEILLQAAVNCILPKEWNGVHFGGLERLVMYFDLDCRFDVLRLSEVLRHRLMEARGFTHGGMQVGSQKSDGSVVPAAQGDDELFLACMRRFLYIRCYSSYEFLATLKTVHYQIPKECEARGVGVHFLMIDSISAFYWMDRASQPLPPMGYNRTSGRWPSEGISDLRILSREKERYREFMPSAWQWNMLLPLCEALLLVASTVSEGAEQLLQPLDHVLRFQ